MKPRVIRVEPARYAYTGGGLMFVGREEYGLALHPGALGCLDAPDWLPIGSVRSDDDGHQLTTTNRPGAWS